MENKACCDVVCSLHLPRYGQLPDAGLFLEQASAYIDQCLGALPGLRLTGSMISNYVKKGLLPSPVRKQYNREQIAQLIFITVAKTVLTMEEIQLVFQVQRRTYPMQRAYDYFCQELEQSLQYVFNRRPLPSSPSTEQTEEVLMLRSIILTAAHRLYLTARFAQYTTVEKTIPTSHKKEIL